MGCRAQHPPAELPQLGSPDPAADLLGCSPGLGRLMCRHLGWLGEPRSLASLVLEPPSDLLVQSYAPRRQKHGLMNADGWGVGFSIGAWRDGGAAPHAVGTRRSPRWRRPSSGVLSPRCVRPASACRSRPSASAPFTDGQWLLSHNGLVDRTALPLSSKAESTNDSALLAALIFERVSTFSKTPSPRSPPLTRTPG